MNEVNELMNERIFGRQFTVTEAKLVQCFIRGTKLTENRVLHNYACNKQII